ncbi:MAG: hypothetical protein K1060chlam1_00359 [Candidatus Anoxychlamydiales bacterium]|nr:hypothetical protein [Candidatus Anoxychlamydiales bacterium]
MNLQSYLNPMKTIKNLFLVLLLSFVCSCYRVEEKLEPKISYTLKESHVKSLKNPFKQLTLEERSQDWGKEFIIAKKFAKELDLYRAITNFRRSEILLPEEDLYRQQEIEYNITLSYYLGQKFENVIEYFEKSSLCYVDKSFEAFKDLLIILYESYRETENEEKTQKILELLKDNYPETEKKILLSTALIEADVEILKENYPKNKNIQSMIVSYKKEKKSVKTAQLLNTFIPGSGYLYIGQKKSAATAFLLNGLFIYATYEFFHRGWTAAGTITASFEAGWYFGGIYGAGEEANFYNERIYESKATPLLNRDRLFPIFLIKYGF